MKYWIFAALCIVLLAGCVDEPADKPVDTVVQEVEGWETLLLDDAVESAHPYANNMAKETSWHVSGPKEAETVRIFLDRFDVERGYDQLRIYDAEGKLNQTLTGGFRGWSQPVTGNTATLVLVTDESVTAYGFRVTAVQYRKPAASGVWVTQGADVRTLHPYKNHTRQKWTLTGTPDAQAVRVNFTGFDTERDYDFVYLYDGRGAQVAAYTGLRLDFTSVSVPGNVVTVELVSDYSVTGYGFDITSFEILTEEENGGCRTDADCPGGEVCTVVQCIRAPCPALCQAAPNTASLAEACGDGVACGRGLTCVGNLVGVGDQVCAAPAWDERAPMLETFQTASPYANDTDEVHYVQFPEWVERYAVQFDEFDLEANYDYAYLFNGGGDTKELGDADIRYTGRRGAFTTEVFDGNHAAIRFVSDYSVAGQGFKAKIGRAYGVPTDLVTVYYDPAQCLPPEQNPSTAGALTEYLAARGITVYGLRSYVAHEVVCRACQCPQGNRFVFLVSPEDAEVFLTQVDLFNRGMFAGEDAFARRNPATTFVTSPIQCGGNAWEMWAAENGLADAPEATKLREWFGRVLGVNVMFTWSRQSYTAVCLACQCARGDELHVVVDAEQAQFEIIETAGFTKLR